MAKVFDNERALEAEIVDDASISVLSPERLLILRALAKSPKYPAEVAKQLRMQAQTAYYHFRVLQDAGLVKVAEYAEKGGALAKKYAVSAQALVVLLDDDWKPMPLQKKKPPSLLKPFVAAGFLDGKIVVGSPDAHGKYRVGGSDYAAIELAMLLGSFASFAPPLYLLDTEVRDAQKRGNLLLVGGPKVNMLVAEANAALPIRFDEKTFAVKSSLSRKTYGEEVGVVELVESPFHSGKKMLVLAGATHNATRVAMLALLKKAARMDEANLFDNETPAHVVQGFDEDGDGIVDAVEILE